MNLLPKAIESVRNGVGAVLEAQLDGTDGKYAGRSGKLVANGDAGVEGPVMLDRDEAENEMVKSQCYFEETSPQP